ncbi:MAG: hypothetical protein ABIT05_07125 [Chitinophagaceae bacterium]
MANPAKTGKIIVTHPLTGTERKMDAVIYNNVKDAILKSLQKSREKTFTELTDDVVKTVRKKMPSFKGSIPWYTISIRLDLETRGIVETFTDKGKKLNRLKK